MNSTIGLKTGVPFFPNASRSGFAADEHMTFFRASNLPFPSRIESVSQSRQNVRSHQSLGLEQTALSSKEVQMTTALEAAPRTTLQTTPKPTTFQSSIADAFDESRESETNIVVDGATRHFSKATFSNLASITAPMTMTTPVAETNRDGSVFTVSAAIIIVGPGGTW